MTSAALPLSTLTLLALLDDRSLIALTGPDATQLLERLLTSEIPQEPGEITASALLSPQGKIQAAFLLARQKDGYFIDCPTSVVGSLMKRLKLYRLRADVALTDMSADHAVLVAWRNGPEGYEERCDGDCNNDDSRNGGGNGNKDDGDDIPHRELLEPVPAKWLPFPDPRSYPDDDNKSALGTRFYVPKSLLDPSHGPLFVNAPAKAWHERRRLAVIAEQGPDFDVDEVFPTDINLDQLGGVSYTKGCFVGQEVVSRMHHRKSERRRILRARSGPSSLTKGAAITAGDSQIGTLCSTHQSSAGDIGLALVRVDRLAAASAADLPLICGGNDVHLDWPAWLESPQK